MKLIFVLSLMLVAVSGSESNQHSVSVLANASTYVTVAKQIRWNKLYTCYKNALIACVKGHQEACKIRAILRSILTSNEPFF